MARKLAVMMAVGVTLLQAGTLSAGPQRSRESRAKVTAASHLENDRGLLRREKEASEGHAATAQIDEASAPEPIVYADGAPRPEDAPANFLTMKEVRALDPNGQCESKCKDCSGAVFNVPDNFNHSDGVWCFCLPNATMSGLEKAPGTWPGVNHGCATGCAQNENYTDADCADLLCTCDVNVNYATGQADVS
mmetsp:Transcript_82666/g.146027  ORF Transcript_82666/g.146027 Transcript_82666/m.146027 type:complete len:192 (+) Transcript_82666:132-707(+)